MIGRLVVPDEALRWGALTTWWGEWRTGLRRPPEGRRVDLVVWDDLPCDCWACRRPG